MESNKDRITPVKESVNPPPLMRQTDTDDDIPLVPTGDPFTELHYLGHLFHVDVKPSLWKRFMMHLTKKDT